MYIQIIYNELGQIRVINLSKSYLTSFPVFIICQGSQVRKMSLILLFLEKILEAIYFSMFLLIGKNIKEKRILFTLVMIFEYVMLTNFIEYNVWFQLIYTFMSYMNLKVFYKEKAQITDIFLFAAASILLIVLVVSAIL